MTYRVAITTRGRAAVFEPAELLVYDHAGEERLGLWVGGAVLDWCLFDGWATGFMEILERLGYATMGRGGDVFWQATKIEE